MAPRVVTDQRDLSRALRAGYWPRLKKMGFLERTDRAAWRYVDDAVDVVELWTVGAAAIACGCTPVSVSAIAASIPAFMPPPPSRSIKDGKARPRYPDCELQIRLTKTLSQPWFLPFATTPVRTLPKNIATHLEGLRAVLRSDRHDRPDIWFVKEDGSNLDQVIEDLWQVTAGVGLPMLDRVHDPCAVVDLVDSGAVTAAAPDSIVATAIRDAAEAACHS
ncbi:MAG TPA: hypothetical protein VFN41_09470 [Candidatus Limnocylindrales bacterium]|nr:hypothetical protein [Candidatus Limnocylindrales bacterium]